MEKWARQSVAGEEDSMKYTANIVGICFSPREEATAFSVKKALEAAESVPGISTTYVGAKAKKIATCRDCGACLTRGQGCVIQDDFQELLRLYQMADGLIIGSPVYGMNGSPLMYAFHSRLRSFFSQPGKSEAFCHKVGVGVAVGGTRHGGQEMVLNSIRNYFLASNMFTIGGPLNNYGGAAVWSNDRGAAGVEEDPESLRLLERLGKGLAIGTLIAKIGKQALEQEGIQVYIP